MTPDQYKKLFDLHYLPSCLYALRFLRCPSTAEDVVQEAFVCLWEQRLKINSSPKSYLFGIIRNKSMDIIKRNAKQTDIENYAWNISMPDEHYAEEDATEILERLLLRLPPKSREIFEMSRSLKMKYREIADDLDISTKAVEKQISKVIRFLLDELSKDDFHLRRISVSKTTKKRRLRKAIQEQINGEKDLKMLAVKQLLKTLNLIPISMNWIYPSFRKCFSVYEFVTFCKVINFILANVSRNISRSN
ncbi:hypothetical protein FUAX_42070 (plasmid) [Fulvitalea axinellae]|uniref:RNA polymerase sigma-70 factor n=1 Tax=Fulvitalea axinellae TaxID=1182444 RepID=A0AAU9DGT8_9BACT|nr:hypothetical protein FUAX_42070 [Fulvitalea axinellae]